jgi:dihydroneopterin aldolase
MIEGAEKPPEDSIDQVLDYEYLLAALYRTLEMERPALLETLATRLLDEVLAPAEAIAASVRITKLDALEDGGSLGCSMTRLK